MYKFSLRNHTMSISICKLTVTVVHSSDISRIVDYLINNYFTTEPLSKHTQLTECPEAVEFLRKFCTDALNENVSMVATTSDGDIAAVACNIILRKHKKFDFGNHQEINKISDFIVKIGEECNIYEKYPGLDDYMYLAFVSVHEDFRKQGLAKRLIDHSKHLAAKLGLNVMRMDCCSLYTAKAVQRLGWTCLKEIRYDEYKIDGQQVFCPEEPHTTFGVYILELKHAGFFKSSKTI